MAQVKERIIGIAREIARKKLQAELGELFKKIPEWREVGLTCEEIGRKIGRTRQAVSRILKHHFPESCYPKRPEKTYLTRELLKSSGKHPRMIRDFLRKAGFKPIGIFLNQCLWPEEAKNFIHTLLNRQCLNCSK